MDARLYVPHAIVFLFDPTNDSIHVPEYSPGSTVASNESCLSICTAPDADSDVFIELFPSGGEPAGSSLREVFRGELLTPGKKISLSTSAEDDILQLDVDDMITKIVVLVDQERFPGHIRILVGR